MTETKQQRSDDFAVRCGLVSYLLGRGIPRNHIRHEITLDSSSSGGRADVVLLSDGCITGFEIKSGKDTLMRCDDQLLASELAFDRSVLVLDRRHAPWDENDRFVADAKIKLWPNTVIFHKGRIVSKYGKHPHYDWLSDPGFHEWHKSCRLSGRRMLSVLWANEITVISRGSLRHKGITVLSETLSIQDIRRGVVAALHTRQLNRWEATFWTRFDLLQPPPPPNTADNTAAPRSAP